MTEGKLVHRKDYRYFVPITTRWMDNDIYGHVNNVTYYSYFDTAANEYLIKEGRLDINNAPVVGFVVHSNCSYLSPIAYPDKIEAGLCVKKIGNSSVTYGVGIFKKGEDQVCAYGELVHVFVDRNENKSVSIPAAIRGALEKLLIN
ncbi:acyl-CoA thioesterase [Muriicola sp. Z0-33]|uniref:acyl-CoA thioesterase n=1 Tax=Muriicola sp. Z0-33 TaxID=2816957 RepID=UPI002238C90B|nr:thioesterase family protein [Muriicola sp. Z0-33]MCW5517884.1 acyl-CoA thioesterase [Muriicola sp. Z0-33]